MNTENVEKYFIKYNPSVTSHSSSNTPTHSVSAASHFDNALSNPVTLSATLCSFGLLPSNKYRHSHLSDFCEITLLQILLQITN